MKPSEIHIDEENILLFWALIAVVSIAIAAYMLFNAFMMGNWAQAGYTQLISLGLFSIGFYAIIRISSPLFHFVLKIMESNLTIEIWYEGDEPLATTMIELNEIEELRISPHTPRSSHEALFDFSTSYHLLYRGTQTDDLKKLIDLEGESFTLKVEDIRKIMTFLVSHNPQIYVPETDALFIEINQRSSGSYTTAG